MAVFLGEAVDFTVTKGASAYPRANYLANGNILGAYTAFTADIEKQRLVIVTSTDNGMTFKRTGTAASRPIHQGSIDNAYPLQLPSGRVVLAYRNHDENDGHASIYRITLSYSDDEGANWRFLSDAVVVNATSTKNGVWEPYLRNAKDGTLQLYYSRERSHIDQDNVLIVSRDGGRTWGQEVLVSVGRKDGSRDGMIGVTEVDDDGSLLAVFETNFPGKPFNISCVSSSNDGMTWKDRRPIYTLDEMNAGAPQITKVGNTLAVSYMTDEDLPREERERHRDNWARAAGTKLITSNDGGKTWDKMDVFPVHSAWPGLLAMRNRNALLYLAGHKGAKCQAIAMP